VSVRGNLAGNSGTGIVNVVTLLPRSSVTNNTSDVLGGGIANSGIVTLDPDSSVMGNTVAAPAPSPPDNTCFPQGTITNCID
jgi:hypothetical protein